MMLRCAARISSGSARSIAFVAAARSPRLIASSTERTALRISVRRDLLITVRRAILRVAFLAEVVLAIVSNLGQGLAPLSKRVVDAMGFTERLRECRGKSLRKKCRRRSKNSGGGIAPAAICALIEAGSCSVNVFGHFQGRARAVPPGR